MIDQYKAWDKESDPTNPHSQENNGLTVLQQSVDDKNIEISNLVKESKKSTEPVKKYYNIALVNAYLELVKLYVKLYELKKALSNQKKSQLLRDGRKALFESVVHLRHVYGKIDGDSFCRNQDLVDNFSKMNPQRLLNLLNLFLENFNQLFVIHGENSKYQWSLLDVKFRFLDAFKNALPYRDIVREDPHHPYYVIHVDLVMQLKKIFQEVSQEYRKKFLVATKESFDMQRAIILQEDLLKINIQLTDSQGIDGAKKTIDNWKEILKKEEQMEKKRGSNYKK